MHPSDRAHRRYFLSKNPYMLPAKSSLFMSLVRKNLLYHQTHCDAYAKILDAHDFQVEDLHTESDLYRIPLLTSLYFKRNALYSMPLAKLNLKATSSGTKGLHSQVAFDKEGLTTGILMMIRFFKYHKLISLIPTQYIVLGFEPAPFNHAGAVKTAYGTTKMAPAWHREYVMKAKDDAYSLNLEGVKKALLRYIKWPLPIRFVGFPSYMYHLITALKEHDIKLKCPKGSKVLLGGGWKQFSDRAIDPEDLYRDIETCLGIPRHHCYEFFSAVEHPLPYLKCLCGNFHIPIYSRVIIRDPATLKPTPHGTPGLLSFVSPLVKSMPLTSIATDDLAIYYDTHETPCPCGLDASYFKLLGRAGVTQIKTCTLDASETLKGASSK